MSTLGRHALCACRRRGWLLAVEPRDARENEEKRRMWKGRVLSGGKDKEREGQE